MQPINVNDRVSRIDPSEDSNEILYFLEVEPGQLEKALLEPEEILKENGVEVPEDAAIMAEFSQMQRTADSARSRRRHRRRLRIKIVIVYE